VRGVHSAIDTKDGIRYGKTLRKRIIITRCGVASNAKMSLNGTLDSLNTNLRRAARGITMGANLDPLGNRSPLSGDVSKLKSELAFINCDIFDGLNSEIKKDMRLLVKDGKIRDLGYRDQITIPDSCHIVDARGQIIMPGMIDGHVHQCAPFSYRPNWSTCRQMMRQVTLNNVQTVNSGVTTVCDMGGPQTVIKEFTELVDKNRIPGPRYLNCYTLISPSKGKRLGYPSQVKVLNPLMAWLLEGQVASRPRTLIALKKLCYKVKEDGGTHLKTTYQSQPFSRRKFVTQDEFPVFDDDWMQSILKIGKETGLVVDIHAPYRADVEKCVDLAIEVGARIRIHHMTFDEDLDISMIRKMSDHGFYMIPTVKIYGDAFRLPEYVAWLENNPQQYIMPEGVRQSKAKIERGIELEPFSGQIVMEHDYAYFRDQFNIVQRNTQRAHDAGIIGIGTDSGGTYSGFFGSINREVRHYVEFGISLLDTLKYLTSKNARINGLDDRGVVQQGKLADLIVVDGNPLIDPSALAKVTMVIKGGVLLKRMEDELKERVYSEPEITKEGEAHSPERIRL
jgi:imidazolonepropionase-like amidohydrolase